jgi:hypothetical protein
MLQTFQAIFVSKSSPQGGAVERADLYQVDGGRDCCTWSEMSEEREKMYWNCVQGGFWGHRPFFLEESVSFSCQIMSQRLMSNFILNFGESWVELLFHHMLQSIQPLAWLKFIPLVHSSRSLFFVYRILNVDVCDLISSWSRPKKCSPSILRWT